MFLSLPFKANFSVKLLSLTLPKCFMQSVGAGQETGLWSQVIKLLSASKFSRGAGGGGRRRRRMRASSSFMQGTLKASVIVNTVHQLGMLN